MITMYPIGLLNCFISRLFIACVCLKGTNAGDGGVRRACSKDKQRKHVERERDFKVREII